MNSIRFSLLSALWLTGCPPVNPDINVDDDFELSQFQSCADMSNFVAEATLNTMIRNQYGRSGFEEVDTAIADSDGSGAADEGSPSDYSSTNVQEKGVDEPDLVKTDGDYIYVIQDGELLIVDSWPLEDAKVVGRMDVGEGASSIFLRKNRIAVYGSRWAEVDDGEWLAFTDISVIDIADRSAPEMISRSSVDGNLVSGRMIGDDIYTVVSRNFRIPDEAWEELWMASKELPDTSWDSSDVELAAARIEAKRMLRPSVRRVIGGLDAIELLPRVVDDEGTESLLTGCSEVYHSDEPTEPSVTSVVHLNIGKSKPNITERGSSVMGGSLTTYASTQNMYIAQTSDTWWDGMSDIDRNTRIHRFSLDDSRVDYAGSGVVDGFLLNQFSMSEYKGMLRVATTSDDWWWGTTSEGEETGNNVFVLDADGAQMGLIGELRGLAPGERIYSARFQGERAFLVTFVQVDPLFTIDLSNPIDPKAVGELKIPGYSAYLHPFGNDHIVGVGVDGTWDGWTNGIAISLFNVSDFADPQQQDKLTLEMDESWSEALFDHRAITVHRSTLALPVYGYDWDGGWEGDATSDDFGDEELDEDRSWSSGSGLLVTDIDGDSGISRLAFIDHAEVARLALCEDEDDCYVDSWDAQMRRSVIIEDHIVSISTHGMRINPLDEPSQDVALVIF